MIASHSVSGKAGTGQNRYINDLSGGLAIDLDGAGQAELQISNLRGDIVASTSVGQAGISMYTQTQEYGLQDGATKNSARYGWLGTHQRDTNAIGGLVLMGARLFAPTTGRFLSVDLVDGGNDSRYTYPPDPVNRIDITGQEEEPWWHASIRHAKTAKACLGAHPRIRMSACSAAALITHRADQIGRRYAKDNRANAVRHFVWQVTLSMVLGLRYAKRIGDAHDWDLLRYDEAADSRGTVGITVCRGPA